MSVTMIGLGAMPMVREGDDLVALLAQALDSEGVSPVDGDVIVVCQKIVSKAEGRTVALDSVTPRERARKFAAEFDKDAAVVELALAEASDVLRMQNGHLITVTGPGWICANSGIDRSNQNTDGTVTLLPRDADRSAEALRAGLRDRYAAGIAIVVSDTFGRPWRLGQIDVAIGAAGLEVLDDHQGGLDLGGRPLEHTVIAVADQLAAAAGLLTGKAAGIPAVLIRGYTELSPPRDYARAADLIRPPEDDMFR